MCAAVDAGSHQWWLEAVLCVVQLGLCCAKHICITLAATTVHRFSYHLPMQFYFNAVTLTYIVSHKRVIGDHNCTFS
jgi:hypothetical protein